MTDFVVGGASLNQTPLSWESNVNNIIAAIEAAKKEKISLLCLPELCLTGYGCEDLFLSEWLPEKAISLLPKIAETCTDIAVAVGLPVRLNGKTYNTTALIVNQKIDGIVAKKNMAIDGVHYEFRWFTPWKSGEKTSLKLNNDRIPFGDLTFTLGENTIGFEICEDAWRKDRPALDLVNRGVNIILNPSASHFALQKSQDREKLVVESSVTFNCTYVYANLLGNEAGRMIYDGDILIAKNGQLVAKSKTLSFKAYQITKYKLGEGPSILESDRSINEEFAQSLSLALFDYLRKSKTNGFVLSISGGADSGTCAVLVHEMVKRGSSELGWKEFLRAINCSDFENGIDGLTPHEKVRNITGKLLICAYQATKNSSDETFEAAQELCEYIGAGFVHWNLDEVVNLYTSFIEKSLDTTLNWDEDDITLQNIQARSRSPVIWMLANKKNSLLLVTSNRSEGDVGYATMDGDTSGSIAPIAGIDKPFIKDWLKWAEQHLEIRGLKKTNELIPTAELRPSSENQTDEQDLMPYAVMVEIERKAVRDHLSPIQVYRYLENKNLTEKSALIGFIDKFYRLWAQNQWKRERTAPSFHLDDFNIDPRTWCRFPILSSNFENELEELHKET